MMRFEYPLKRAEPPVFNAEKRWFGLGFKNELTRNQENEYLKSTTKATTNERVELTKKILKTLEENETSFGLTNITNPLCISSIDGDFLFAGLNASNHIIFKRYGSANWDKTIDDKEYLDCIIGAYPF